MKKRILTAAVLLSVCLPGLLISNLAVQADNNYHPLSLGNPFVQDWSNVDLITTSDDWSGVPSITGYNDNVTDNLGGDPQLHLIPSTAVDVNPNQNNPALYSTGGVTEFDRGTVTDPTIALQGVSNSDYPNIDIRLNTTACTSPGNVINIAYDVRDIDNSADNTNQQVALHYRVGSSGNYTNIPEGYIADATTGPNLATLVTPISVNLPPAAQGEPQVHVRIMTSNAPNNDEWVGIDNINITCQALPDTTAPAISFTSLGDTPFTSSRVLSVTITDAIGVADGALLPRIYFRKNGGAYNSTACSLASGDQQSGTYSCTIDNSLLGGVTQNDLIEYFVIAQDAAGNVASSPAGVDAIDVNTVTDAPGIPASYSIIAADFSGSVSVGAGQAITSLTNNEGLFELMNAGTISGNVTVNITSDLTSETGTHGLNQLTESGAGGYAVFFQASGGARTIEGSNGTALITLNGADRVTFSGLAFGPGGLTFRNTGDGATIRFINDATSDSVVDCVVEGGTTSNSSGVIFVGAGPSSGNDEISISDSTIRDRSDGSGVPVNLIYVNGAGGVNSDLTVLNNQLFNFTQSGLSVFVVDGVNISQNTVYQTNERSTNLFAIQLVADTGTLQVEQNTIRDISTTGAFVGINLQSNGGNVTASRNRIYSIDNSTGSFAPFNAIQVSGSDPTASVTLVNNMVSLAPDTASNQTLTGILDSRTVGTLDVNYNTVLLEGPAVSDSWAFRRTAGSGASISLIGNLFFNDRSGASNNYAAADDSGGSGSWSSDFNLYAGTGSDPASYFQNNGTPVNFEAWQAGTPARDSSSRAGVVGEGPFNVGNIFVSPDDPHLKVGPNNPAINAGADIGLGIDIDGNARPLNGAPDIGADEVQAGTTAADVSIAGRVADQNGRGLKNVQVVISGGDLIEPIAVSTTSFGYFRLDGLRAGETYVVHISSKRYVFNEPIRTVSVGEDALNVDFLGEMR